MVNFPVIFDLSKVKDFHKLLFSLPYLILNFFGSAYLLLWAINDFNFVLLSDIGTIILAFPLSSIIFIFFTLLARSHEGLLNKQEQPKSPIEKAVYLNFAAGWFFTIGYVGSLFITTRSGGSLLSFGLKSGFLSNFVIFYVSFFIIVGIRHFIKRIKKCQFSIKA